MGDETKAPIHIRIEGFMTVSMLERLDFLSVINAGAAYSALLRMCSMNV